MIKWKTPFLYAIGLKLIRNRKEQQILVKLVNSKKDYDFIIKVVVVFCSNLKKSIYPFQKNY